MPHFTTFDIFFFSRFLFEVQEHSEQNKMGVRNLAMVFGPNILRSGVSYQVIGLNVRGHDFSLFQRQSMLRSTDKSVHRDMSISFLVLSDSYGEIRGMYSHTVAPCLVCSTPDRVVRVQAQARDIVLCSVLGKTLDFHSASLHPGV